MDVATDSKALRLRVRKASRARAPDSPSPGEDMAVRTARPDEERRLGDVPPEVTLFDAEAEVRPRTKSILTGAVLKDNLTAS